jgi:hypothetical protein
MAAAWVEETFRETQASEEMDAGGSASPATITKMSLCNAF